MSRPVQRESDLEKKSRAYAIRRGWMFMKFVSPGKKGPPDRIMIRRGRIIFIEFKRPGEVAEPHQLKVHREMREHGASVFLVDNLEQAIVILT